MLQSFILGASGAGRVKAEALFVKAAVEMGGKEAAIKARYALAVLRVSKGAPRQDAIRLIEGLATERPDMETNEEVAEAWSDARDAFDQLSDALRASSPILSVAWDRAMNKAARWLDRSCDSDSV